jgi:hypothetical protein
LVYLGAKTSLLQLPGQEMKMTNKKKGASSMQQQNWIARKTYRSMPITLVDLTK